MYNHFVLPFLLGMIFLFSALLYRYGGWILHLSKKDKQQIFKQIFTKRTIDALVEIFKESLLHLKIFKTDKLLGYMHSSLAFGWFLLIVVGDIEARMFTGHANPPYYAVFFRFFEPATPVFSFSLFFAFAMDFLLLIVLSGVALAYFKRLRPKSFGMKKTTRHSLGDKIALSSLWLIFPLRLLAESTSAGIYDSGSFLTGTVGHAMAMVIPLEQIFYPIWWMYSLSLGLFFVALPFSRYMHIPTEVLLIFLRNYGVANCSKERNSFTEVQLYACSRCGLCIDKCQLNSSLNIGGVQSVYFLREMREHHVENSVLQNCLMCGRCVEACPVGIETTNIRLQQRISDAVEQGTAYQYLETTEHKEADVLFFAGCMTRLTPSILHGMIKIFDAAKVNYLFMDEDISACCGRPLLLSGHINAADKLFEHNKKIIINSKAQKLVTGCPICYKVFKEEYQLDIEILHHTEYIEQLINERKITLEHKNISFVYHDPCDLGRGSNIYNQPREIASKIGNLLQIDEERNNALCCGGSLANTEISSQQRNEIAQQALKVLKKDKPDVILTACPLCKKTFSSNTDTKVADIAEIVARSIKMN